ncbi:MAG: hypothetical protein ACPGQL_03285 [Thermoplasmatota archaeon]
MLLFATLALVTAALPAAADDIDSDQIAADCRDVTVHLGGEDHSPELPDPLGSTAATDEAHAAAKATACPHAGASCHQDFGPLDAGEDFTFINCSVGGGHEGETDSRFCVPFRHVDLRDACNDNMTPIEEAQATGPCGEGYPRTDAGQGVRVRVFADGAAVLVTNTDCGLDHVRCQVDTVPAGSLPSGPYCTGI